MAALHPCRDRKVDRARGVERKVGILSGAALSIALLLLTAALLAGAGVFIARSLESSLLGFLGADFLFLLAASVYTAGPARSGRSGR